MHAEPFRSEPPAVTLGANRKHCFACANVLDVRAELCPRCGVRQPQLAAMPATVNHISVQAPVVPPSSKSKIAAALLAFFLGGFGIHKFYLGRMAAGVLYFLFCWTLIPSVIAFFEFIILLSMSDEQFDRRFP
ncbi:MAG: TM2 domain-containing protein [Deltaproteobacteria bacterium]|nr:TM2 domain-containing protein [Deltaproteobacteria bacterium]MCW5806024.1 TM2 domain-containing protein [Deltaproteobacteria bacterium]